MAQQYIMTAHQLHQGDVVTEQTPGNEHPERHVRIKSIEYGAVRYRRPTASQPVFCSVIYVAGEDLRTHRPVKWAVTGWRRWVARRPEAGEI